MSLTGFHPLWDEILSQNLQAVADQGCHLGGYSPGPLIRGYTVVEVQDYQQGGMMMIDLRKNHSRQISLSRDGFFPPIFREARNSKSKPGMKSYYNLREIQTPSPAIPLGFK
jgi:hypothetical protein